MRVSYVVVFERSLGRAYRDVVSLIVAIAAVAGAWLLYSRQQASQTEDEKNIAGLQQQLEALQSENNQLKENLSKSQSEEERLSAANEDLTKALAQAQLTGKIPPLPPSALPYPPK